MLPLPGPFYTFRARAPCQGMQSDDFLKVSTMAQGSLDRVQGHGTCQKAYVCVYFLDACGFSFCKAQFRSQTTKQTPKIKVFHVNFHIQIKMCIFRHAVFPSGRMSELQHAYVSCSLMYLRGLLNRKLGSVI